MIPPCTVTRHGGGDKDERALSDLLLPCPATCSGGRRPGWAPRSPTSCRDAPTCTPTPRCSPSPTSSPSRSRAWPNLTGVSGTTMTTVAEALLRDGLVERIRNPVDRRSYALTRTPAGRAAVRRWEPDVQALEQRLTAPLTPRRDRAAARATCWRSSVTSSTPRRRRRRCATASASSSAGRTSGCTASSSPRLEPLGIEPRHFGTLRALRAAGPVTQGQLAELLDVSPPYRRPDRRPPRAARASSPASATPPTAGPTGCTAARRRGGSSRRRPDRRDPARQPRRPAAADHAPTWCGCCRSSSARRRPRLNRFRPRPGGTLDSPTSGARSSTDRASDYGSEGWGFESLRARSPKPRPLSPVTWAFVRPELPRRLTAGGA